MEIALRLEGACIALFAAYHVPSKRKWISAALVFSEWQWKSLRGSKSVIVARGIHFDLRRKMRGASEPSDMPLCIHASKGSITDESVWFSHPQKATFSWFRGAILTEMGEFA
jgi:hypothetical protein